MESNVIWDIVKIVLGGVLGTGLVAILPTILALRKEREEKAKIVAESDVISMEAVQKLVSAAADLQDSYVQSVADSKARALEYKQELDEWRVQGRDLRKSNEELILKIEIAESLIKELPVLRAKIEEINSVNVKLLEENRRLVKKIDELTHAIEVLSEQIEHLGGTPVVSINDK